MGVSKYFGFAKLIELGDSAAMRILVACDKFKGSLSAVEACEAVRDGLKAGGIEAEFDLCPIADGGEGFAEGMVSALQGEWVECGAVDALGRKVKARYGLCRVGEDDVAVMEMAESAGMWRIGPGERDIMRSTTAGVGQMIRHASKVSEVDRILLGLGGSATNDGGVGMAAALGITFRDSKGWELEPIPAEMEKVAEMGEAGRIGLPRDRGGLRCGQSLARRCGGDGGLWSAEGGRAGGSGEVGEVFGGIGGDDDGGGFCGPPWGGSCGRFGFRPVAICRGGIALGI